MSAQKVKVVVELVVTDANVARYIERAVAADPTTYERGGPMPLAEALADFLFDSIGPSYPDDPDPEAEAFFDLFSGEEWLQAVTIKTQRVL